MSRVSNDLNALIAFRDHLIRFNRTLQDEFASMSGHWREMGDVWNDAKYHEFGAALEEVNRGIERYLAATDGHEAYLLGRIVALRDYLG